MGDATPVEIDQIFGEVAFGDTLVLADQRQGDIASVVRESELVVILKFFPDCDYDGMIMALDMLRRNGVSRTGITIQERLGGGAFSDLERMADQIDQLDAEVEAHHLLDEPNRAELDARFKALESQESEDGIEDELAALKAKLRG